MTQKTQETGTPDLGLVATTIVAVLALTFSVIALVTRDSGDSTAVAGDSVQVSLTEWAITPDPLTVGDDGQLLVTNDGSIPHNLVVPGTGLATTELAGGQSEALDVSSLAPGDYELICDLPGHAAAGMTATLTIPAAGGGSSADPAGDTAGHDDGTDWEALDRAMEESMLAFPAETEGIGNVLLEPEIMPDGTKRFELTAAITPWEVEPGKIVDAWTYNGMVPGPWIKVDVGDAVQIDVTNELPMGTDVHWHGIAVPNDMDGVAPYTQDLIDPGETFSYIFDAVSPAVGMYHAHHHGHTKVPNGMLGVFQIGDVELPRGQTIGGRTIPEDLVVAREIPMVLNDAGVIGMSLNGKGFPATEPYAVDNGDWILVHYLNEGLTAHPMHQHQFPQLVVAKDGFPLEVPYFADTVNVAPGERYSVLIHADDPGVWVWHCHILTHVERDEGMFGMVTALIVS